MKIGIFDAITQENNVRDMTIDELADYQKRELEMKEEEKTKAAESQRAIENKAALLAKLGITAEEAKLLLS